MFLFYCRFIPKSFHGTARRSDGLPFPGDASSKSMRTTVHSRHSSVINFIIIFRFKVSWSNLCFLIILLLNSNAFLFLFRNNQLTTLPREICLLPLKILLVSNNRLTQLPDELGRMDKLTELDASCNQITQMPNRMAELRQLRAILLRNNQLVYIPREVTSLQLVTLDVSGNRIGKLPTEMRHMSTLVNLELENNPLTCPPANVGSFLRFQCRHAELF